MQRFGVIPVNHLGDRTYGARAHGGRVGLQRGIDARQRRLGLAVHQFPQRGAGLHFAIDMLRVHGVEWQRGGEIESERRIILRAARQWLERLGGEERLQWNDIALLDCRLWSAPRRRCRKTSRSPRRSG